MKQINWPTIVLDLIYLALGIVFIIRPEGVESMLCYILAAAVAVIGLLYLGGYFIQRADAHGHREGNGFAFGILLIIMAVFIVAKQELVISLVPFLFGVMVMIRGLMIIQNIFIFRKMGFGVAIPLATGLLTMALGLFVMLFPFQTATFLFILIGIGLMVGGVTGIVEEIMMRGAERKHAHAAERARDMEGMHPVKDVMVYGEDDAELEVVDLDEETETEAADPNSDADAEETADAKEDQTLE